jgi:ferrous-iron efflux pump FieF
VATATVLVVAKLGAWLATGSVSVLASLVDSLMDAGASLINFFAVRYSLVPADAEHRFGHGKAEALAALAQATFIAGSAIFLVLQAVDRLMHPRVLTEPGIGIGIIVFAMLATMVLLLVQRHVIRRTGSAAIRADALHYATDFLANLSIIVALVLASFGWGQWDAIIAMGIAIYILHSAYSIGIEALDLLMDRELPESERQTMLEIARTHARTHGVHDLRTRQSGATKFVQLHLEMDDDLPLIEAHAIANEVEAAIKAAFPETDIVIHQDPASMPPHDRTR